MTFPSATTFAVLGMKPGSTKLDLRPGVPGKQVARILYPGRDVTEAGIETGAGQKIEGIQIVLGVAAKDRAAP